MDRITQLQFPEVAPVRRRSPDVVRRRSPDLAETPDRRSPFRVPRFITTLGFLLSLTTVSLGADEPVPGPLPDVEMLVSDITEGDANARKEATEKLLKAGEPAVAPLAEAAETDDAEVVEHCLDVLGRLMVSPDPKTAAAAKEALQKLAKSDTEIVGIKARNTLRLEPVLRTREALLKNAPAAPGPAGGVMRMTATENGKSIQLQRTADGSFEGKVTEIVDGKKQVTEIKAASEKELEEKFPEAHKAFQKQQKLQPAAPRLVPGFPLGGQAQIQIFGAAGPRNSTRVTNNNGNRTIEIENGDEKIVIKDVNGKDIELKHTRPVDGKSKTDEFKADDLDDLKKKHPEAAKLYEKHAGAGNLIPGGGAGGIQIQINGGGGFLQVQPRFQAELAPRPSGPRTIRSELDGRKIEVSDEDGKKIRVKLIKVVDGKDVAQEFSADDLKTLKAEHPEAAKLYEQLTGRKE